MRSKLSALLFLLLLQHAPLSHAADAAKAVDALKTFEHNLNNVSGRPEQVRLIKQQLDALGKVLGGTDVPITDDYVKSLRAYSDALKSHPEPSDALLKAVGQDIDVKFRSSGAGVGDFVRMHVRTTVITKKGNQPAPGFLVRCNPKFYEERNPPLFAFNNPTTPSEENLPPGLYRMWLEKESEQGTRLHARDVSIGKDGKRSESITFEVAD